MWIVSASVAAYLANAFTLIGIELVLQRDRLPSPSSSLHIFLQFSSNFFELGQYPIFLSESRERPVGTYQIVASRPYFADPTFQHLYSSSPLSAPVRQYSTQCPDMFEGESASRIAYP